MLIAVFFRDVCIQWVHLQALPRVGDEFYSDSLTHPHRKVVNVRHGVRRVKLKDHNCRIVQNIIEIWLDDPVPERKLF